MTDLEARSSPICRLAIERDTLEETPVTDSESNRIGSVSDLDPNFIQSNLFNSQIAAPFLEEHLSKSIMRFKRASEMK